MLKRIILILWMLLFTFIVEGQTQNFSLVTKEGKKVENLYKGRINYTYLKNEKFNKWDQLLIYTNLKDSSSNGIQHYNPNNKELLLKPTTPRLTLFFCLKKKNKVIFLDSVQKWVTLPGLLIRGFDIRNGKGQIVYKDTVREDSSLEESGVNSHVKFTKDYFIRVLPKTQYSSLVRKNNYFTLSSVHVMAGDKDRKILGNKRIPPDSLDKNYYRLSIPDEFPSKSKIKILRICPKVICWRQCGGQYKHINGQNLRDIFCRYIRFE